MLPHPHSHDPVSHEPVPLRGARPASRVDAPLDGSVVHIDCDDCAVQGLRCGDCVVPLLLGTSGSVDGAERAALTALADGGLVPRLQLVPLGLPGLRPGAEGPVRTSRSDRGETGPDDRHDTAPPAL